MADAPPSTDESFPLAPKADAARSGVARRTKYSLGIAAVALAIAAALGFASHRARQTSAPASVWTAIPSGADLVVFANVERLSRSGLVRDLPWREKLMGGSLVAEICGFDPTLTLREVVLVRTKNDDLAFVATGTFEEGALVECGTRVIKQRGGEPVVSRIGSFSTVREAGANSEIATRADGLVVVGEGAFFRALLDTAEGRLPVGAQDPPLEALRKAATRADAVVLLRGAPLDQLSPGKAVDAGATPGGKGVATRIELYTSQEPVLAKASIECPTVQHCKEFEFGLKQSAEVLTPLLGETGPGSPKVDVVTHDSRVDVSLSLSMPNAQKLLALALTEEAAPPASATAPSRP